MEIQGQNYATYSHKAPEQRGITFPVPPAEKSSLAKK